jgi:hypothetical protein
MADHRMRQGIRVFRSKRIVNCVGISDYMMPKRSLRRAEETRLEELPDEPALGAGGLDGILLLGRSGDGSVSVMMMDL